MKKVVYVCDNCSSEFCVLSYRLNEGCEMDPSGNGYNTNWKYVDWCSDCYCDYKKLHPKQKIERIPHREL